MSQFADRKYLQQQSKGSAQRNDDVLCYRHREDGVVYM